MFTTLRNNILSLGLGLLLLPLFFLAVNSTFAANDDEYNFSENSQKTSADSHVESLALSFSKLLATSSPDSNRGKIALAYAAAIQEINTIERHRGLSKETKVAREIMQKAIDRHMNSFGYDPENQLTHNLHIYSKYLTETLIYRSADTAPRYVVAP